MNSENPFVVEASGVYALRMPMSVTFSPQPDITAYELAMLLPYLLSNHGIYAEDWAELGTMKRHLIENPRH